MQNARFLLKTARRAVETFVKTKKLLRVQEYPKEFVEKRGVFVSIYKGKELRGCIGFPYPQKPLIEAVIDAAVSACKDPRFEPLKKEELNSVSIEISVLSVPKELKVENRERLPAILNKNCGYIIEKGLHVGLFLPQVWNELPDRIEFLENLCMKAYLPKDSWLDPSVKIYEFKAEVLRE